MMKKNDCNENDDDNDGYHKKMTKTNEIVNQSKLAARANTTKTTTLWGSQRHEVISYTTECIDR